MRKIFTVFLTVCLFFCLAGPVFADVIWEPYGDSFYESHRDEIDYEGRVYQATHDLPLYKKPNGRELSADDIYAGNLIFVQYVFTDKFGAMWGLIDNAEQESAWVDLSGCIRPYDREDFRADYQAEFQAVTTQPDVAFYENTVLLYDYPGKDAEGTELYVPNDASYLPEYKHTYTDPAGNVWAELMYYMAQDGWVLLSGDIITAQVPDKAHDTVIPDPDADNETTPGTENAEDTAAAVADDVDSIDTPDPAEESASPVLPVILVIAAAAVTAAVLLIFFRRKK